MQIFTENPQQGSLIVGRMLVDGDVYFKGKKLALTETGEFVFGVGRESDLEVQLEVKSSSGTEFFSLAIAKREWKIERVDGLPPSKVNPTSPETLARIKKEGALVRKARQSTSFQTAFMMQFIKPAEGRISGVYGSQRVLNGEPKRPHFGLDIANKVGTPVVAPADGVVTLAEKDLFYSGGSVIIDHGYGISTTYIHLDSLNVKVGQELKQGELIGGLGATGRATGPHLDWRLNWYNTRLDPQLLLRD
ncbi:MAG: M23 family metallopeptidase [Kangiellaceae bacterium]